MPEQKNRNNMDTLIQAGKKEGTAHRSLRRPRVLRVIPGIRRDKSRPGQQRPWLCLPRELNNHQLSAYERDYLNWYHGDPLKRSLVQARKHSVNNRTEVLESRQCGCFHCGARFSPGAITTWLKDSRDHTASCPECDMDAVLGDASGYHLSDEFLAAMQARWYHLD